MQGTILPATESELPFIDADEPPPGPGNGVTPTVMRVATTASKLAASRDCDLAGEEGKSERVLTALLYLLVQFSTRGGDVGVVMAIGQHLEMLAARCDISPSLRATSLQLRRRWLRACLQAQAAAQREHPSAHRMH